MHTTISPFTLAPWKEKQPGGRTSSGWQGTSAEFGEIRVACPAGPNVSNSISTEASGGQIPRTRFETRGLHTETALRPTLNGSTLRVGDALVRMDRNRWAPTHRGRSLRMTYLGDSYRLTALGRRAYELSRSADSEDPGALITVRQTGLAGGRRVTVRATGRVLAADIALAVLFCEVDRSVLTRRGAVRAGMRRIFFFWTESQS
ncbi:hypothetical protein ACIQM4_10645 [Streptomyces sp. NPDC091272]|uniref:hypothetical protein n=1 Tax=Streptomyces sp. NPDC091272 TaxID=3365981 RepID=UPI00382924D9